ncbi:transcriptional regulator, GntR family [Pseudooceanicola antarcticus]|uniref:PLP-dependent aminotransferase family protein n=1 Tax=Pseudooceanicola antarcticus TaxID=1247613 RepID=A0A285HR67_9RHOB|nr:PLP-dependent aminotransferase family protein [Pseudooceanicola antarcticus]PJE27634.1 PLP-dependent aminotransferase family protein [Pseudooceanicola antarcticus]SNY38260.1 transcriptional regulator, GntR family [Pseudooceanicola antarcticus]
MLNFISRHGSEPIQSQLRRGIVDAIHSGQMQLGQKMPASRQLAGQLGIARNTVTAVYEDLVARGYLESRPRLGVFVARDLPAEPGTAPRPRPGDGPDWDTRLNQRPSRLRHLQKPSNWQDYRYPFISGQVDPSLFPINTWRSCSRDALGRSAIDWWTADRADEDDPLLVEQIRSQILPQRGIYARSDEILVTLGAQEGLYLLARLLAGPGTTVGCERPGYPDSRHIMQLSGAAIRDLSVDGEGARLEGAMDLAVLTPGFQSPTMVTMSPARQAEVLDRAARDDILLIEDDYEGATAAPGTTTLRGLDRSGRVAYLGTLSKILAPGVRLGFLVADPALVAEARWLRRLIHRSAPLNNQRTAGIFLAEGHYLALQRRLREALMRRHAEVLAACARYLPGFRHPETSGGTSLWLECPEGLDGRALITEAARRGVLIESGDAFVPEEQAGRFLRLGISHIDEARIDDGLAELGRAADSLR